MAEPKPPLLGEDILDAGEGVDHDGDQGAVAQTGQRVGVDAFQQRARFFGRQ